MTRETRQSMIAERAYRYWEERGRPLGSPEIDWFRAEMELCFYKVPWDTVKVLRF